MKTSILSQLLVVLIGLTGLHASAQTTSIAYSGTVVTYVVPAGVTSISISARGAQGGNETMGSASGGQGAIMSGNFAVTPGQVLKVLAGGQGMTAMYVGGGGGGSFVWDNATNTLLIAAGGGGGAGWDDVTFAGYTGTNATTTTTAANGYTMTSGAGAGGSGGTVPSGYAGYAGGGAGWLSNGNNGSIHGCLYVSTGGISPLTSGMGGTGGGNIGTAADGGFGGGGGGNARCGAVGGGGGGGYSGGGAGGEITLAYTYRAGGGGGSYNAGTSQVNSIGNIGNGLVTITTATCTPPAAITGTLTVCSGSTTALADATPGGTWSSSATSIASVDAYGVVTGGVAGTATITYTVSGGCYATVTITVNSAPAGGAIIGTTSVCAGMTTALSNPTATAGGTWSSSTTPVATVSGSGIVTGVAAGVTIITYSVTTACGTAYATTVVTVNVSPAAITGPLAMCAGSTVTLSSLTSGGVWSSSNPAVASMASGGVVTAVAVGTSTVSYAIGSCVALAVVTVTTGAGPITGPTTVCLGSTISLSGSVPGGTWTSGLPPTATVGSTTGVVTGVSVGGTSVTYAVGTCSVSTTIAVVATPAPITPATAVQVCVGGSAMVSDPAPGGTWSSSSSSIASITSAGLITGLAPGVTTISYTDGAGCAATKSISVNTNPPAIAGSLGVCMGATSMLTNSMAGGTWVSSAPSIASIDLAAGVLTGVATGTSTITYTISSTGCFTTSTATVGATPAPITGPAAMCGGGATITLSNATAGGVWSSGTTSVATIASSGVATSGAAGTTIISYTVAGCTPATQTITVAPSPSPIAGVLGVCKGVSSTLTDATAGGVWSSSDPTVATISSAGVVFGMSPGTTTITYAMPGACYITAMVTVDPLAPIMGPDSICAGGIGYYTNIVGGGTWASSNPAVADIDATTAVMTTHLPGPTFVQYTLSAGCYVNKLVMVTPQVPPISGPDRVCTGSVTTLTDAVTGGTWTGSNAYVATIGSSSGILVAGSPDTVRITYTVAGVGCMFVKTMTVEPIPVPVITFSGMATHTLSTYPYYTSYQWFDSSAGLIPGANTMALVIPANVSKHYYVEVTDANGCTGAYTYNFATNVGVGTITGRDIQIYPNPVTDKVIITSPVRVRATITDIAGRQEIDQPDAKELNVSGLAAGVYIITLYDDNGSPITKEKLVKY